MLLVYWGSLLLRDMWEFLCEHKFSVLTYDWYLCET